MQPQKVADDADVVELSGYNVSQIEELVFENDDTAFSPLLSS